MPAVDPQRLRREAERVAAAAGDPARLRRAVLELLEFYADRTRRPAASGRANTAYRAFGAPRAVVTALGRTLSARLGGAAAGRLEAAAALWEADYREVRVLAAGLLEPLAGDGIAGWVEARGRACDDPEVLSALAGPALSGWRAASPAAALERLEDWTHAPEAGLRALGLLGLAAALEEPGFDDVPAVFRLLSRLAPPPQGEPHRAYAALLTRLARRSPRETSRLLLDGLALRRPGMAAAVRSVLPALPTAQRERLGRALSTPPGPGIIPPLDD